MKLSDNLNELQNRRKQLDSELEEMEAIYGDNFPEPSAQLDRWNKIYDEWSEVINKIALIQQTDSDYENERRNDANSL
jgi:hypothetical protein